MKNAIPLLLLLHLTFILSSQNGEVTEFQIGESKFASQGSDTITTFNLSKEGPCILHNDDMIRYPVDLDRDFAILAVFEVIKTKTVYGISFINANGGNKGGLLINSKGEYAVYLLFDGSSCLLDGKRSFEDWKSCEFLNTKPGETNALNIQKNGSGYDIRLNNHVVESYTLSENLGDYFFTHWGILVDADKNQKAKLMHFEMLGVKKME